jgi:dipeptidyl aminopeptidase/acylaminoacyl peptidase
MRHFKFIGILAAAIAASAPAVAKPPMEAFGDAPEIRLMELSPDGSRVTYLLRQDGKDVVVVHDLATSTRKGLSAVSDSRPRGLQFVGNNYVVLIASTDTRVFYSGRFEYSSAFAFNLATGKNIQLLRNTNELYPAQSGLGNIVGVDPDGQHVFMPAYMGAYSAQDPSNDLLRVPLESGRGVRSGGSKGTSSTVDWIMNAKGEVIAREDFSTRDQKHEIRVRDPNGQWRTIHSEKAPLPTTGLVGATADGKSLIIVDARDTDFDSVYTMSIATGAVEGPVLQRADAEVDGVIMDNNRVVYGVRYSGMFPTYDMLDESVDADIRGAQKAIPGSAVYLDSWSQDWSKLLFFVEGGKSAERYMLLDRAAKKLTPIIDARPTIKETDIGEVVTVEYKARDGLKIPGLITWPTGVAAENRKNLPLVVMPHGGPEAYDSVGFDWLAQFLANEGYAVLQPNFRGSAGFGQSFRDAGRGEWGRKMQDDITDGMNAMAKAGWIDPARACIVGWSYGGYAALAGGALTPDAYKCVASVAGVSNLRDMISSNRIRYGANSRSVTYWEMLIGDTEKDREAIEAVSPARLAASFKAPVLLVHGDEDTTVPVKQSDMMNDALKAAGKTVKYIRIGGDDHGLGTNESRRQVLTALSEFLAAHIGKAPAPQ